MIVLTLEHKEVKKFLKKIPHNKIHKRALKLQGAFYYIDPLTKQKYYIEDLKILRKILGGKN